MRKQTLVNAERYLTDDLQDLERKLLSARQKRTELENEVFEELKQSILSKAAILLEKARLWSEKDVLLSLAWLAIEESYVRPELVDKDHAIKLSLSRHPVVEQEVSKSFVPNDFELQRGHTNLITGPNMAGKSTIMRQVAIMSLLAQVGSFVPAQKAKLPIFDRIFTRIGASDSLSEGLSTFMVEMTETSEILSSATSNSLIVLDEIGRGTSTYDGMSLAQALIEHIATEIKGTALFATHYHELTTLESESDVISNAHMGIRETQSKSGKKIEFLYTLESGPANKSYGIEVGRLAGLPESVIKRAQDVLLMKESVSTQSSVIEASQEMPLFSQNWNESHKKSESLDEIAAFSLRDDLLNLSVEETTPLEALQIMSNWKRKIEDLRN